MARKTSSRGDKPPARSRAQVQQENAERARQALQLRTMRTSWESIARQCGYASRGAAFNAVQRELAKIPREAAKELRTAELEALDAAQRAIARQIANGNLRAIDRMLRIMDSRAKLTGLYDNIADTGVAEVNDVLAQWLGKLQQEDESGELDDDDETGDSE